MTTLRADEIEIMTDAKFLPGVIFARVTDARTSIRIMHLLRQEIRLYFIPDLSQRRRREELSR